MGSLQGRYCLNGIYFYIFAFQHLFRAGGRQSGSGRNRAGTRERSRCPHMLKCPTYSSEEADILE